MSLIVAILLPSVGISLYFYSVPKTEPNSEAVDNQSSIDIKSDLKVTNTADLKPQFSYSRAFALLWRHFLDSYSNPKILQWSLWWSLAMAGFLMVQFYVQFLWQVIDIEREYLLNAGVEAALTLLGAVAAFLAGFMRSKTFQKFDLWILTFCSLVQGVFVVVSSQTTSIWLAYAMYVLFGIMYSFMITVASATVAQHLADDSFALIFGFNTLIAVGFQTIITAVVITWLELLPRDQFLVYGMYFVGLSVIFLITAFIRLVFCRNGNESAIRD